MKTKNFVTINGLKWDTENLAAIKGKEYFTHDEALAAASLGKRLPTPEEWQALIALGSTWDDEKRGRWFGYDHELKSDSKESIFLPAAGYRDNGGTLDCRGYYGFYWSARKYSVPLACSMRFYSNGASTDDYYGSLGFSVRLVKD